MESSQLKNLGPTSREWLNAIGIHSAEALRQHDPFDVYATLKATFPGVGLNMLYALIGAVENENWQTIKRTRKADILMRLDDMGLAPKRTAR